MTKRSSSLLWVYADDSVAQPTSRRRSRYNTYAIVRVYEDHGFGPNDGKGTIRGGELQAVVKAEGRQIALQMWAATEEAMAGMKRWASPLIVVMDLEDYSMSDAVERATLARKDGRLKEISYRHLDNDGKVVRWCS